jgi:hypothetical protein
MELPDIVRESLGDEEVVAGVRLGDEDLVVFTATRTVLYRGEGLLSDEGVSTFPFDFERLQATKGRRKTSFTMSYMDGERDFSVPKNRGDTVLERLIEGSLRVADVIESDEAVTGVFRFSELTLVVTEGRLLKHVGEYTWDSDFEAFDYDGLTRLDFEEGSVATQVVLGTGTGRTERIKAPNQQAGAVRKSLQRAVFDHYDVGSLEALNRQIEPEEGEAEEADAEAGLGLDSGIDPLVQDADDEADQRGGAGTSSAGAGGAATGGSTDDAGGSSAGGDAGDAGGTEEGVAALQSEFEPLDTDANDDEDIAAVADQLDDLTQAVERQNELLYRQQKTVEKLIEELRQGR